MKTIDTFREALRWLRFGARIHNTTFSGWRLCWGQEEFRISGAMVETLVERDAVRRLDDGTTRYGARYAGRSLS